MTQLAVTITERVEDGAPPIVRCCVVDAAGKRHEFVEKLAIVSTSSSLPAEDTSIACLIVDAKPKEQGRRVVTVDVSCPWGCETIEGLTTLEVLEHQLAPSAERWIAIDGRPVPAAIVGTNDGLNYGRFFDHPTHEYQAVLPIACLDWYAPEFAALVDEMREDDERFAEDSSFAQMGYRRTLTEAAEHPSLLADIIETFCDRELLAHHFPFNQSHSQYVINSTDAVHVIAGQIIIRGRCWRYQSSSNA
jgi:hypothetical protein